MATITINSAHGKHEIIYSDAVTTTCIGVFSNKRHAKKMATFLTRYEDHFGEFFNYEEAATRLINAVNRSPRKINFVAM